MVTTKSFSMGSKATQTLYYAAAQAERVGFPFNAHVTINFAGTRCDPREAPRVFARLRGNLHQKWAARLGGGRAHTPTWLYVFENVRDKVPFMTMAPGDPHNVHVHWLLHVPATKRHDFEMALSEWVETVTGGIVEATAVLVTYPGLLDVESVSAYLRKGTAPPWAAMYCAVAEPQGLIVGGRRSGTSRNIGRQARKAADREEGINRRANLAALHDRRRGERFPSRSATMGAP